MTANPVLVETTRGGQVESRHRGALCVADGDGAVRLSLGEVARPIFPRSAIKLIQALPLVESGAADAAGLSSAELALACASHSGQPMHTEAVAAWLMRQGMNQADLACPAHAPMHAETAAALIRARRAPCRLHNNCSGKHSGFLTLARHLGRPLAGYERRDHAVQEAVFDTLVGLAGLTAAPPFGIDGCAAPNPFLPLQAVALAMARLAAPERLPSLRAAAARRLVAAMAAHPELVAGSGRACTRLIPAATGGAVVKLGAEGVYVGLLPALGFGFALKIDDGAGRASEVLAARLLDHLGAIAPAAQAGLADLFEAPVTTWGGVAVGTIRVADGVFA